MKRKKYIISYIFTFLIIIISVFVVISLVSKKSDISNADNKIYKINNVNEINPNKPGTYLTKKTTQVNNIKIVATTIFTVTDGSTKNSGGICALVQVLAYLKDGTQLTHKWIHYANFSWNGKTAKVSNTTEDFTPYNNIKVIKKSPSITHGVTNAGAAWAKGQYFVKWHFPLSIIDNVTTSFTKLKVSKNGHIITDGYYETGSSDSNNTTKISHIINGGMFDGELIE